MPKNMPGWEGWHFLPADCRLTYGDGRLVVPGETLTVSGPIKYGVWGLHAARQPVAAFEAAPFPVIERVQLGDDEPIEFRDEFACSASRTCLWLADATMVLHEFACWCAVEMLRQARRAGHEPDQLLWATIEAKRQWIAGKIDAWTLYRVWWTVESYYLDLLVNPAIPDWMTNVAGVVCLTAFTDIEYAVYEAIRCTRVSGNLSWGRRNTQLETLLWELAPVGHGR